MSEVKNQVRAALAERLVRHVETLANTTMNLSMSEWNEISNHILEAACLLSHPAPDVPGAEHATMMRNLCSFINAVWAATDDAEGGTMDADGQEIVLIPLERFNDVCNSMDELDRMTTDYTGWLGYRVKTYLSAQLDAAREELREVEWALKETLRCVEYATESHDMHSYTIRNEELNRQCQKARRTLTRAQGESS